MENVSPQNVLKIDFSPSSEKSIVFSFSQSLLLLCRKESIADENQLGTSNLNTTCTFQLSNQTNQETIDTM